jgi:tetratricopeptide (TPR) repeat protein
VADTLAGDFIQAAARLQKALDIFAGYPAPWQMARTQFEMGELARTQGLITEARDHYSQALSVFEDMRAAPYAARTRAALADLT